jgi:hypothetical protein
VERRGQSWWKAEEMQERTYRQPETPLQKSTTRVEMAKEEEKRKRILFVPSISIYITCSTSSASTMKD